PGGPRGWGGPPTRAVGPPPDLVVYGADPRADVRALAAPRRVVVNGRVVG
ncbi:amidohydrolase, partial [Streptomyces sp. NPDC059556]